MSHRIFKFGSFELCPERSLLQDHGKRVPLGSRALRLLTVLVEKAGETVPTDEIVGRVWSGVAVEAGNVRVQLAALRRALRDGKGSNRFIVNEPGRGYRFVAEVTCDPSAMTQKGQPAPDLPRLLHRLIGREDALAVLLDQLSRTRLVSVVGPGGVGKTSLALAALSQVGAHSPRKACFVDLSAVAEASRVPNAMAAALRLPLAGEPLPAILRILREGRMLILLDNCEHVVEAAAALVEAVLSYCPEVTILATSREPLRCQGETLHQLHPLRVPLTDDDLFDEGVTAFPAIELFMERAGAALNPLEVTGDNVATVALVCRQLDGVPLALELAAACVGVLGLKGLTAGLDTRLDLLVLGRRTMPRHESLRAMLDWSYELLTAEQQTVFASLSVFKTAFTLDAVVAVTGTAAGTATTFQAVSHLAAKSLLMVTGSDPVTYRMLETTRSYAAEKLQKWPDPAAVFERHAAWVGARLAQAEADWQAEPAATWWDRNGTLLDEVRAALDWCYSPNGITRTGVDLTIASAPIWLGRSQLSEFAGWIRKALVRLHAHGGGGDMAELRLQLSLGTIMFYVEGPGQTMVAVFRRALELADALGHVPSQATALWALAGERGVMGDGTAVMALAERMAALTRSGSDPEAVALASRTVALAHFRLGNLTEARIMGERLIQPSLPFRAAFGTSFRYHHTTAARANLACVLWLQGSFDRALKLVDGAVRDAAEQRNPSSFCYILSSTACPIAFWSGDHDLVNRYVALLRECSEDNAFSYSQSWAGCYAHLKASNTSTLLGERVLQDFRGLPTFDREILMTIDYRLVDANSTMRALTGEAGWCSAELQRARGEQALASLRKEEANDWFARALAAAGKQGALAWELRAATSWARSLAADDQFDLAMDVLAPVVDRVCEGKATKDVVAAISLMGRLKPAATGPR